MSRAENTEKYDFRTTILQNEITPIVTILEFLEMYKNNEIAQKHLGVYENLVSFEHASEGWDCYNILYHDQGVYYYTMINLFFEGGEVDKNQMGGLGHRVYIGRTDSLTVREAINKFKEVAR